MVVAKTFTTRQGRLLNDKIEGLEQGDGRHCFLVTEDLELNQNLREILRLFTLFCTSFAECRPCAW